MVAAGPVMALTTTIPHSSYSSLIHGSLAISTSDCRTTMTRNKLCVKATVIQQLSSTPACKVLDTDESGVVKQRGAVAAFLVALQVIVTPLSSNAILYSPDTKVPRTGELALRKAIPANPTMKGISGGHLPRIPQKKPYGTMEANVKKALKSAEEGENSILDALPSESKEKGSELYTSLVDNKGELPKLIEYIKEKDADKVSVGLSNTLDVVAELELLQAPGLSFLLPEQYLNYPRLTGRGVVEFTIEKTDGSTFFPSSGGDPKSSETIQAGLGGLSFDEGQFSVMGYVTTGRDVLSQIKSGDLIRSAKLLQGKDNLVLPNAN